MICFYFAGVMMTIKQWSVETKCKRDVCLCWTKRLILYCSEAAVKRSGSD